MIAHPHPKINIGLYVTEKRPDGFHNLETIFYPIDNKKDIIEIELSERRETLLRVYPSSLGIPEEENLCMKAYRLLEKDHKLPFLTMTLHKGIPAGAGMGGGSSDAAWVLKMVNQIAGLNLSNESLKNYAARLGSDVPFFIDNQPVFATGRGEVMEPVDCDLSGMEIRVDIPPFPISTAEAYRHVIPQKAPVDLREAIRQPVEKWRDLIRNDFEESLFVLYPPLARIKQELYEAGAEYVSLSGSGSAIYSLWR